MNTFKNVWTDTYSIQWRDTTANGLTGIVAMMNFFQESAWHHADYLGFGLEKSAEQDQAWVIVRFKIVMDRYPSWADSIKVDTWPSGRDGVLAFRDFKISTQEGELLGYGTSAWMVINILTRRPKKLDFLDSINLYQFPGPVFQSQPGKIILPEHLEPEYIYKVRYGDMDAHGHVNNVRYAAMIMEGFDQNWHKSHFLKSFEINFMHEAIQHDELSIKLAHLENGDFFASINRLNDNQLIVAAHLMWKKSNE
jgi:medium-chain acyl-[acyl-carrier-protein] hydrolase